MKKNIINFSNTRLTIALFISLCIHLSTYSQSTILNNGFESGSDSSATDWSLDGYGSGRTTSYASNGLYSMSVWNWYYYIPGNTVNGELDNPSDVNFPLMYGGTPFTHVPESVHGMYLYDTSGTYSDNDSAVVEVFLKKYNLNTESIDTVAYGRLHLSATEMNQGFVPFELSIEPLIPNASPDSIVIVLKSSLNGLCDQNEIGNCLYFYVDELSATLTTGISLPISNHPLLVGPNPVVGELNISLLATKRADIRILDTQGQLIIAQEIDTAAQLDLSHLSPGIYTLIVDINGSLSLHKIMKR